MRIVHLLLKLQIIGKIKENNTNANGKQVGKNGKVFQSYSRNQSIDS